MPGWYHGNCECCEIPTAPCDCDDCDANTTPLKLSVTFSGIAKCSGIDCFFDSGQTDRDYPYTDLTDLKDPNSTFELDWQGTCGSPDYYTCLWSNNGTEENIGDLQMYSNDGATRCDANDGELAEDIEITITVELSTYGGTTTLSVFMSWDDGPNFFDVIMFDGENTSISSPIDCTEASNWPTVTNNQGTCDEDLAVSSYITADNTGTCVISPI